MLYNICINSGSSLEKKILELRKQDKSYREIAEILDVSRSTVSYWLADNSESQGVRKRLARIRNSSSSDRVRRLKDTLATKWGLKWQEAKVEADKQFAEYINDPLFVAGINIYWGEGDSKPNNPLRIGNTDPRMIKVFVVFLKKIMRMSDDKIRISLILYPDLGEKDCINFWLAVTGLRKNNLIKPQYIKGRHPTKKLLHGICTVTVNSKWQKTKILTWIDLLSKKLTMYG